MSGIVFLEAGRPDGPWAMEKGSDLTTFRKAVAAKAGVRLAAVRSVTVKCPSCAGDPVKGPIQAWLRQKGFFAAVWI